MSSSRKEESIGVLYRNDGRAERELYRTQARVMVGEGSGAGDEL